MTFKLYEMLSSVVRNIIPNILKDRGAIMFRIHQYKKILLRNTRCYSPINTTCHPRRLEYSANRCENLKSPIIFHHFSIYIYIYIYIYIPNRTKIHNHLRS